MTMRRRASSSCVEVLAYCFMSNHFHILVYVPDPRELSDDELLARYLTPLTKSGYIAVAGGEKNRYLPGKQYRILRKGKAVVRA